VDELLQNSAKIEKTMQTILIILEVLLMFNLMIVAHEWGHFAAARWRGMVVEKFGIWFGKPLWKRTWNGVEYSLGWIPAGGFVALPQMATMETIEGKTQGKPIPQASPWDKIIVAAAGPAASLGMAFVLAIVVWGVGRPISAAETTTVIGWVVPSGPAAQAGLEPGDKILSVDGNPVSRFSGMGDLSQSIQWNIARSTAPLIEITFQKPDGKVITAEAAPQTPEREGWGRLPLRSLGFGPAQTPVIARVLPNSPAEKAGLRPGDALLTLNGKEVWDPMEVAQTLKDNGGQVLSMGWERSEGKRERDPRALSPWSDTSQWLGTSIIPQKPDGEKNYRIGIVWDPRGTTVIEHPNPFVLIASSAEMMVETFRALFTPASNVKAEHLTGPVGIMRIYYLLFETADGWRLALWFSVILNVNLALLNLLPLPVLDGGHITLSIIEAIRRRPLPAKALQGIQTAFALLLMGYLAYVTFFDLHQIATEDLPSGGPTSDPVFSQKADASPTGQGKNTQP
jgi:regulator of sigma E protease